MLRVAIPNKGTLADPAREMLREAGYFAASTTRELVVHDPDNDVEFFFLRPRDVATYVGEGTLDVGITGRDMLLDSRAPADELLQLGFGGSTFRLAAPKGTATSAADLNGKRIATSYAGVLTTWLQEHGITATVVELDGAVENAVALGVATHFSATKNDSDPRQRNSPFLYPGEDGKPKLDFARYCEAWNAGSVPDLVTVFLGPNDIFSLDDANLEAGIDTMIGHYDALLAMVRQAGPDIRFAALLPVPPAATQDAFGANYASGQTRWQYKRNQHRLVERMIAHYGNRESEKVYVIPTHLNLDCALNYPAVTEVANSRSESQVTRLNNGVHPAASGYRQIADTLYAWIKATSFTTHAENR